MKPVSEKEEAIIRKVNNCLFGKFRFQKWNFHAYFAVLPPKSRKTLVNNYSTCIKMPWNYRQRQNWFVKFHSWRGYQSNRSWNCAFLERERRIMKLPETWQNDRYILSTKFLLPTKNSLFVQNAYKKKKRSHFFSQFEAVFW